MLLREDRYTTEIEVVRVWFNLIYFAHFVKTSVAPLIDQSNHTQIILLSASHFSQIFFSFSCPGKMSRKEVSVKIFIEMIVYCHTVPDAGRSVKKSFRRRSFAWNRCEILKPYKSIKIFWTNKKSRNLFFLAMTEPFLSRYFFFWAVNLYYGMYYILYHWFFPPHSTIWRVFFNYLIMCLH